MQRPWRRRGEAMSWRHVYHASAMAFKSARASATCWNAAATVRNARTPGRINDHHYGRDSTRKLISRGVADLRRSYDDPLVPVDVLPTATPDRQRTRPLLQPDRLNPDLPIR